MYLIFASSSGHVFSKLVMNSRHDLRSVVFWVASIQVFLSCGRKLVEKIWIWNIQIFWVNGTHIRSVGEIIEVSFQRWEQLHFSGSEGSVTSSHAERLHCASTFFRRSGDVFLGSWREVAENDVQVPGPAAERTRNLNDTRSYVCQKLSAVVSVQVYRLFSRRFVSFVGPFECSSSTYRALLCRSLSPRKRRLVER